MMSPTPDTNRENPKRNEQDQEIAMPDVPQFIVDSDDEDDDAQIDLENGGYQMLAQEPGTLSGDEWGDDNEGHIPGMELDTGNLECDIDQQPAPLKVPHLDPPEVVERQEVWKGPAPSKNISLDQEKVEQIKSVMKNIQLPQMNIPSWAKVVPEQEWTAHFVDKPVPKNEPDDQPSTSK